jgi:hypothetical protein
LQNDPSSRGAIVGYGSCDEEGLKRAQRAKDYLVNTRGIDAGRIDVIDGGLLARTASAALDRTFGCELHDR